MKEELKDIFNLHIGVLNKANTSPIQCPTPSKDKVNEEENKKIVRNSLYNELVSMGFNSVRVEQALLAIKVVDKSLAIEYLFAHEHEHSHPL